MSNRCLIVRCQHLSLGITGLGLVKYRCYNRNVFVSPAKVIDALGIRPSMAVADFGCGSGHYTIEAARLVGRSGKVYAVDIQKDMLGYVRSRAESENLSNIETIWTDLEKPNATRLKDESVDVAIISNIFFQAENKKQIIKEARRILKSGGRAGIIEWDIEKEKDFGPPIEQRISPQDAKAIFGEAGFILEKEFNPGEHHYGLTFIKK